LIHRITAAFARPSPDPDSGVAALRSAMAG
jgi:hypothetical protein